MAITSISDIKLSNHSARNLIPRIEALAKFSESKDMLTRRFATTEHKLANELVETWMQAAGMRTYQDAVGNLVGRYDGTSNNAPAIMLGSHLDTVINAGRFDGMLGVLSAIAVVETLNAQGRRLACALEVIAFADEEGVRYQSTFLGSRAVAGNFDKALLSRQDKDGITMRDALELFGAAPDKLDSAIRHSDELLAYVELHIEQGPVLEKNIVPVGVVSSIAGANRFNITLNGFAGHAGTVPMHLRQDALAGAAECIVLIESRCAAGDDLVGTVGRIEAEPGAGNVISGSTSFSIDIRAPKDDTRRAAVEDVLKSIEDIASKRNLDVVIETVHEENAVHCDPQLVKQITTSIAEAGYDVITLPSGAGHDAAAMAAITPVAMIFVRCDGGISHNPAEYVSEADAVAGADVLLRSVLLISEAQTP